MEITRGVIARAQKVVIYGVEGIGKSTLASKFPNPLFIDTEGSTDNMDVARLPRPTSYAMLRQQIEFIKQNPHVCQTLVIDTIDWAENLVIDVICNYNNVQSLSQIGYGNGYIALEEELGRMLNHLSDLIQIGIHVVLLAHAQIRKFELPDELGAFDKYELKLGKKTTARTSALVKEWADMVLFCNYKTIVSTDKQTNKNKAQGNRRVMYAQHQAAFDAKNRVNLPEEMPLDYSSIAHVFEKNNVLIQTTTMAPDPATTPVSPMPATTSNGVIEPSTTLSENSNVNISQESKPTYIPQSLWDLMKLKKVTEAELQECVSRKGYYPKNTPISNYETSFIESLVANWEAVYMYMLKENITLPF